MIEYKSEIIHFNTYRIITFDECNVINVVERWDCRDKRVAIISLFGLGCRQHLSFDNENIDRFLFL